MEGRGDRGPDRAKIHLQAHPWSSADLRHLGTKYLAKSLWGRLSQAEYPQCVCFLLGLLLRTSWRRITGPSGILFAYLWPPTPQEFILVQYCFQIAHIWLFQVEPSFALVPVFWTCSLSVSCFPPHLSWHYTTFRAQLAPCSISSRSKHRPFPQESWMVCVSGG